MCFLLQHTITDTPFILLVQNIVLGKLQAKKKNFIKKTNYKSTSFLKFFCALTYLSITKTQYIKIQLK